MKELAYDLERGLAAAIVAAYDGTNPLPDPKPIILAYAKRRYDDAVATAERSKGRYWSTPQHVAAAKRFDVNDASHALRDVDTRFVGAHVPGSDLDHYVHPGKIGSHLRVALRELVAEGKLRETKGGDRYTYVPEEN